MLYYSILFAFMGTYGYSLVVTRAIHWTPECLYRMCQLVFCLCAQHVYRSLPVLVPGRRYLLLLLFLIAVTDICWSYFGPGNDLVLLASLIWTCRIFCLGQLNKFCYVKCKCTLQIAAYGTLLKELLGLKLFIAITRPTFLVTHSPTVSILFSIQGGVSEY